MSAELQSWQDFVPKISSSAQSSSCSRNPPKLAQGAGSLLAGVPGMGRPGVCRSCSHGPVSDASPVSLPILPAHQLLLPAAWPPLLTPLAQGPALLSTEPAPALPGIRLPQLTTQSLHSNFQEKTDWPHLGQVSVAMGGGRSREGGNMGVSVLTNVSPRPALLLVWWVGT